MHNIATSVAEVCGITDDSVSYLPVWTYETASTENSNGITIFMEQPLFLDPHCDRDILIKRNFYLHGHEFEHPRETKFSLGEWFRYDVLSRPYHLDFSPEGFEHMNEMSEKDTIIDSKLMLKHKLFVEGFLETHIISALGDAEKVGGRRIKKKSTGDFSLYRNTSPEDILSLQVRLERRRTILALIKREHIEFDSKYKEYMDYMWKQSEDFLGMLRYPELQNVSLAIRKHYLRTSIKLRDRNENLIELMNQFKHLLSNNNN